MKALAFALLLATLMLLAAYASGDSEREYHLKLLAVSEDGSSGLTADMRVEIAQGAGKVFIEAEPVTKLDTRISTGIAKEIACESLGISDRCKGYDFFFRIRAKASLIGGPSAGAAAAALAAAAVDSLDINQSIAVTGTINSGGLIGEVGGLKQKIDAAAEAGIARVLIPLGERHFRPANKSGSIDLVEYGKSAGVDVVEVGDIREVLFHLTGKSYSEGEHSLDIDQSYSEKMSELAAGICGRSEALSSHLAQGNISSIKAELNVSGILGDAAFPEKVLEAASNMTKEGLKQEESGNHYSAASFCFGANVRYSYLSLLERNLSLPEAVQEINSVSGMIDNFEGKIPEPESIASLQVRGTVKDRLQEARQLLNLSSEDFGRQNLNDGLYRLAFAKERLGSAEAWNRFMGSHDSDYAIGEPALRTGCVTRLQEAEEYMQYLELYLPGVLKSAELSLVYSELKEKDYSACIFSASLVKAKTSAMLSALGGSENLTGLIDRKLEAAKRGIIRQARNREFPIVGYSYYEYASTLKATDQPSALLFSEYALELSNLNIYVDGSAKASVAPLQAAKAKRTYFAAFAAGFAAGLIVAAARASSARRLLRRKRKLIIIKGRRRQGSRMQEPNPGRPRREAGPPGQKEVIRTTLK